MPRSRRLLAAAVVGATLVVPAAASANTTVGSGVENPILVRPVDAGTTVFQTFRVPASDPVLRKVRLSLLQGSADVAVQQVVDGVPAGDVLASVSDRRPNYRNEVELSMDGVALTPGQDYAIVVTARTATELGARINDTDYADGHQYTLTGGAASQEPQDLSFSADLTFGRFDPAPTAFAEQSVGTIGVSRRFAFRNLSNALVTVQRLRASGANVGDFLVSYDDCTGTTIGAGGTCLVDVRFAPEGSGSPVWPTRSATLQASTAQGLGGGLSLTGVATAAAAGAPGKDGTDGQDGANGADGLQGTPGQDGAAGKDGQNGKDGAAGKDGAKGEKGDAGAKGAKGERGADGAYRCTVRRGSARCTVKVVKGQTGTARVEVRRRGKLIAAATRRVVKGRVALPAGVKAGRAYRVRVTTKAGTLNAIVVAR